MKRLVPALILGCASLILLSAQARSATDASSRSGQGEVRDSANERRAQHARAARQDGIWRIDPRVVERKRKLSAEDPDGAIRVRRTFAVDIDEDEWFQPDQLPDGEPLVFALRDALERKGYTSVPLSENPDFIVHMSAGTVPYGEVDPTRTRGHAHSYGNEHDPSFEDSRRHPANATSYRDRNTRTSTRELSQGFQGRGWEARLETSLEVELTAPGSDGLLWTIAGTVVARESETTVAGQVLVDHVLRELPSRAGHPPLPPGEVGLSFLMLTEDGESYWPTITRTDDASSASEAGLRAGDRIVAIDGTSSLNMTAALAEQELRGEPGTKVTLAVFRVGRTQSFELRRR